MPVKTSNLLKVARAYLWDGTYPRGAVDEEYICYAIDSAVEYCACACFDDKACGYNEDLDVCERVDPGCPSEVGERVKQTIMDRIAPHKSYEGWADSLELWTENTFSQRELQESRLNWLNGLIREFKARGD